MRGSVAMEVHLWGITRQISSGCGNVELLWGIMGVVNVLLFRLDAFIYVFQLLCHSGGAGKGCTRSIIHQATLDSSSHIYKIILKCINITFWRVKRGLGQKTTLRIINAEMRLSAVKSWWICLQSIHVQIQISSLTLLQWFLALSYWLALHRIPHRLCDVIAVLSWISFANLVLSSCGLNSALVSTTLFEEVEVWTDACLHSWSHCFGPLTVRQLGLDVRRRLSHFPAVESHIGLQVGRTRQS